MDPHHLIGSSLVAENRLKFARARDLIGVKSAHVLIDLHGNALGMGRRFLCPLHRGLEGPLKGLAHDRSTGCLTRTDSPNRGVTAQPGRLIGDHIFGTCGTPRQGSSGRATVWAFQLGVRVIAKRSPRPARDGETSFDGSLRGVPFGNGSRAAALQRSDAARPRNSGRSKFRDHTAWTGLENPSAMPSKCRSLQGIPHLTATPIRHR